MNGYSYNINANVGKIYYNEKQKDNIYMNKGTYDSLEIVIGKGGGQNWWSLIYPYAFDGFAYNESETKTDDTNHISTHDIVSSDNINIKFGFIELISKIFK